jgi:hypothetical protein
MIGWSQMNDTLHDMTPNKMLLDVVISPKKVRLNRVCYLNNTTGVTSGAGTAYPSGAPEFNPSFKWGSCYRYSL